MCGVEACVGSRTGRLGHHENHSENDRSAGYAMTKVSRVERSTLIELTVGPASTVDLEGSR